MKPKAIETLYNGYRFRSRLEARWAVFFDTLEIEYEYEKEGYDLGEAGWYLPDFWLPQLGMWAEVKPEPPLPEKERAAAIASTVFKCHALAEQTGHPCLMLVGMPENKSYLATNGSRYDPSNEDSYARDGCSISYYLTKEGFNGGFCYSPDIEGGDDSDFEDTEQAVIVARSARFEHNSKSTTPL